LILLVKLGIDIQMKSDRVKPSNRKEKIMTNPLYSRLAKMYYNGIGVPVRYDMAPGYSDKRGWGIRVYGPGVQDHFVAKNPEHNTSETVETVFRITESVQRAWVRKIFRS
jgi:hypothetical protein